MLRSRSRHRQYQIQYYRDADRRAIRPADTPYVRRHLSQVTTAARLEGARKVLEIGSGSGRFTRLLLDRGLHVVANDVSPTGFDAIGSEASGRLETLSCALEDLPRHTPDRFDRAVGFFVLHHLYDLDLAFASLASVLEPGARVAFCEPNGLNPLFYLQIAVTPSMTWQGEKGLVRMTSRSLLGSMARQGFTGLELKRYGFLPPSLANTPAGGRLETTLEGIRALRPLTAFLVVSGRLGGREC